MRWTVSQTGWAGQGSAPNLQLSLSCCHTRVAMFSSTENEALLLSKLGSPSEGLPGCGHLFSLQIPPSLQVPSQFLSSSFSFFFFGPTWISRSLSYSFRWWRFSASVQRGLCENSSNSDVFLMHLWREMNSNLPNPLAS